MRSRRTTRRPLPRRCARGSRSGAARRWPTSYTRRSRKARSTVSVVVAELVNLTSPIDPEALELLLSRTVGTLSNVLVRHGGAVEEVLSNGVMAVFGVPEVHEDDALRAVRAGAELRDALAESEALVAVRTGVSTGTVVTGSRASGRTVTGE